MLRSEKRFPIPHVPGYGYTVNLPVLFALLTASGFPFFGAGSKDPQISVRIHAEGLEREGPSFVTPIDLSFPAKRVFIKKVAIVNEKDIAAILPFSSADGSLGCIFRLDRSGTDRVVEHTTSARDTIVVALINGRVAAAMKVDKRITDGIVTVPQGFTPDEILSLQAMHPTMGKEKEFESQKKDARASLAKAAKRQAQESKEKAAAAKKKAKTTPSE